MKLLTVDRRTPDPHVLAAAAEVLRRGGLVAFPTETVYGLGADALDEDAVRRIFLAKGRPSFNPLIVHVPNADVARTLVLHWPAEAQRVADAFWPGPLTMVLQKTPAVPDVVTAGLPTVALRVPAHPVAAALLRAAAIPVAAPSANRYTSVSPTTAQHVVRGLGERIDIVIDGGPTDVGIESAVLDLSGARPMLHRPGSIAVADIEAVVGPIKRSDTDSTGEAPRPSPGMVARHYAPRARVVLYSRTTDVEAAQPRQELPTEARVGALVIGSSPHTVAHLVRMPDDPLAYARGLYAALHDLDEAGCDVVLVEIPPDEPSWAGVLDRLRRAAS